MRMVRKHGEVRVTYSKRSEGDDGVFTFDIPAKTFSLMTDGADRSIRNGLSRLEQKMGETNKEIDE